MYFQARSEALFTVILASPATSIRVFLFVDWLWLAKSLLMTWTLQNKWLRAIFEGHPLLKTTPSGGTWNSVHILKLSSSMKESYGSNMISEQANLTADFPLLSVFSTKVLTTHCQHFQMDIDVMETIFFSFALGDHWVFVIKSRKLWPWNVSEHESLKFPMPYNKNKQLPS